MLQVKVAASEFYEALPVDQSVIAIFTGKFMGELIEQLVFLLNKFVVMVSSLMSKT